MHWSTTIPSRKKAVQEGAFMSLFMRQSRGQRVLPHQDSEDTQQQFNRARLRSIKAFLPSFYLWHHSRKEMYQALSRFTVLQATGSWAGAWERGYRSCRSKQSCDTCEPKQECSCDITPSSQLDKQQECSGYGSRYDITSSLHCPTSNNYYNTPLSKLHCAARLTI